MDFHYRDCLLVALRFLHNLIHEALFYARPRIPVVVVLEDFLQVILVHLCVVLVIVNEEFGEL